MSYTSTEKEIQTIAHWFQGWSPMQKRDFYKDLLEKAAPPQVDALFDAMKTLNVQDRPPSIFQCQLKLFTQWFDGWSEHDRQTFLIKLAEKLGLLHYIAVIKLTCIVASCLTLGLNERLRGQFIGSKVGLQHKGKNFFRS